MQNQIECENSEIQTKRKNYLRFDFKHMHMNDKVSCMDSWLNMRQSLCKERNFLFCIHSD